MVSESVFKGQPVFLCDVCGLAFRTRDWAMKCEAWCSTHQSCNLAIAEHAVNRGQ